MQHKKPKSGKSLAEINPELAKEWHPSKNGSLTPYNVLPSINKKVWWRCSKNSSHEWEAKVNNRRNGRGCPICSNRKISSFNSLAAISPSFVNEWHPTMNGELTPNDVFPSSTRKVWWKCAKGDDHEWEASVNHRATGNACPICSNHKIVISNCLATLHPEIAKQWHPSKNGTLTPYDVGPGSGRNVYWKCPNGDDHEWRTNINNRVKGSGCPICCNQKAVKSNCLATTNPALAKEWHPTKNGDLTPNDVTRGANRKVWWLCKYGHVWQAYVNSRQTQGCPKCNPASSIPELRIFCELKEVFPSTQHRAILSGYEVDIYIPELRIGIEYDGVYWHKDKIERDKEKNLALNSTIGLIRIREEGLPLLTPNDIQVSKVTISVELIKSIFKLIQELRQIDSLDILKKIQQYYKGDDWIASKLFNKLLAERNHIDFEQSISFLYPKLAQEWHTTKNGLLLPEFFVPGSHKKVWWKCPNGDDHEWQTSIKDRTSGNGCPICSNQTIILSNCLATLNSKLAAEWHPTKNGNLTPYNVGEGSSRKVWWKCPNGDDHEWEADVRGRKSGKGCPICINQKIVRSNSLATLNPILASEWHPTKNGNLTPYDFGVGSGKKAWWRCPEGDDHAWEAVIASRAKNENGCPYCSGRYADKYHNLKKSHPEILNEWHPTKNGNLKPQDFTPRSGQKVWWKCSKGDDHEWQSTIANRVSGNGCPVCSGRKTVKSNCLATINPELAKEWHPTKNGELTQHNVVPGSNKKVWWKCNSGHEWQAMIYDRNRGIGCPKCKESKRKLNFLRHKKSPGQLELI